MPETSAAARRVMLRVGFFLACVKRKRVSIDVKSTLYTDVISCEIQYVNVISGGYSVGVPPLPIPNREVKPDRADGTAQAGE